MGFSRRFAARLAFGVALLLGLAVLAAVLAVWARAPVTLALVLAGIVGAAALLWRLVNEGNAELVRFIAALERGDVTQSFARTGRGAGFDRLGASYERVMAQLRAARTQEAEATRFGAALADSAPVALLVIDGDDGVSFANKAARRLFGRAATVSRATLAAHGPGFADALGDIVPGVTRTSHLVVDGLSQRVWLDATTIATARDLHRVVAVRNVQAELDRAELGAQVDLVRVLTHEIMNSLTPVTSLAETALRVTRTLDPALDPGIADAQLAIGALARRANELGRFVESYKGFSEAPAMARATVDAAAWIEATLRLFRATPLAATVALEVAIDGTVPPLSADRALLTQVLLNLLKNAAEAAAGSAAPRVRLSVGRAGTHRVRVAVEDSGPGVPAALSEEIFLPFFTTKAEGTGIGLSLARQIVLLHGGQIGVSEANRSCIEMLLPAAA